MVLHFASWSEHSRFDFEVNELSSRDLASPHESLPQGNVGDRSSDNNCETRHIKSVTGRKTNHLIESYNDRPSLDQQKKISEALSSFRKSMKPLQLTKRTQQDGNWTYRLQSHPPRQFKHPQHQFSSSIIKWRFPTICMKTSSI